MKRTKIFTSKCNSPVVEDPDPPLKKKMDRPTLGQSRTLFDLYKYFYTYHNFAL